MDWTIVAGPTILTRVWRIGTAKTQFLVPESLSLENLVNAVLAPRIRIAGLFRILQESAQSWFESARR